MSALRHAAAAPAGGAAVDEIAIATVAATILTVTMLWLAAGHRNGRIRWIGRLAAHGERVSGLPGWAVVPAAIAGVSLLVALFGMYWDISLHIDNGRDAGPLANPAHYFILFGLFGVLFAAVAAIALPRRDIGPTGVRIAPGWVAPTGGVVLLLCAGFALAGFPLDDVWHRLFGQDVTLWGPTHLMLIGGASLATIGALVLTSEGVTAREAGGGAREPTPVRRRLQRLRTGLLAGGLLVALSTLQGEFDFGVPQFRLLFHPVLIAAAASVALVVARISLGRGGALAAVASFLAMRGVLALLVGPVLGQTMPHFPLYLAEALIVELVAWRVGRDRPLLLGAGCGLGIGTIGLAAEWGWSHVFMPIPWPSGLMGEAFVAGTLVAIGGGVLGGWIGAAVTPSVPRPRLAGRAAFAGFVAILAVTAWTLPIGAGDATRATVTLRELTGGPQRTVAATARLDPSGAAAGADWFVQTSWQGGGSVIEPMREVAPGVWRTTAPMPVHGAWKSELRLHTGNDIVGVPIHFPADPAIPAPAIAAPDRFTRAFVLDKHLLQREQKQGVPGWLQTLAYLAVLVIALAMAAALAWALGRLRRGAPGGGSRLGGQAPIRARSRSASAASSS